MVLAEWYCGSSSHLVQVYIVIMGVWFQSSTSHYMAIKMWSKRNNSQGTLCLQGNIDRHMLDNAYN